MKLFDSGIKLEHTATARTHFRASTTNTRR